MSPWHFERESDEERKYNLVLFGQQLVKCKTRVFWDAIDKILSIAAATTFFKHIIAQETGVDGSCLLIVPQKNKKTNHNNQIYLTSWIVRKLHRSHLNTGCTTD